ncbi:uncharacterized protein [Elaeis guineensis]|uniref:uncharacterized protein n=1 Tax=Elaeis guineensis var. tenera TaxID=51953 RepID=UPI003C6D0D74
MALFSVFAAPHVLVLIAVPFFQNSSGPGSDEVICAEDVEGQPAKGVEAEVDPRTRESCPEVHELDCFLSRAVYVLLWSDSIHLRLATGGCCYGGEWETRSS